MNENGQRPPTPAEAAEIMRDLAEGVGVLGDEVAALREELMGLREDLRRLGERVGASPAAALMGLLRGR